MPSQKAGIDNPITVEPGQAVKDVTGRQCGHDTDPIPKITAMMKAKEQLTA